MLAANSSHKVTSLTLATLFIFIFSSSLISASLNVSLSNQGSDVRNKTSGALLSSGNLQVVVYDAASGGNLVYNETFTGGISGGQWNVMLGENSSNPLPLEFGKRYFMDYRINGEDVNFTNLTSSNVDRQFFYAPLGDIAEEDINPTTNLTIGQKITFALGELIDNIADGYIRLTGNVNVTQNLTVNGNVGIGIASPDAPLAFTNSIGDKIHFFSSAASQYGLGVYSNELRIFSGNPGSAVTTIGSQNGSGYYTEYMRIAGGGNVGINTTSPTHKLTVVGDANFTGTLYASNVSSQSPLRLQTSGTTRIFVSDTTGFVGINTSNPEGRLDIRDSGGQFTLNLSTTATPGNPVLTFSGLSNDGPTISGNTVENLKIANYNSLVLKNSNLIIQDDINNQVGNFDDGAGDSLVISNPNGDITFNTTNPTQNKVFVDSHLKVAGAMFVNKTSGRVGIGTSSPTSTLHVQEGNADAIAVGIIQHFAGAGPSNYNDGLFVGEGASTGNNVLSLYGGSTHNESYIQSLLVGYTFSDLVLNPQGGNVGIGLNNPSQKFEVSGNANITGTLYAGTFSPSSVVTSTLNVSGQALLATSSGNVGIGTTSPSELLEIEASATSDARFQTNKFNTASAIFTGEKTWQVRNNFSKVTDNNWKANIYSINSRDAAAGDAVGTECGGIGFGDLSDIRGTIACKKTSGSALKYGLEFGAFNGDFVWEGFLTGDTGTELMRLTYDNNLTVDGGTLFVNGVGDKIGVGTTSPSHKLHLQESANTGIRIESSNVNSFHLESGTGGGYIGVEPGDIIFKRGITIGGSAVTTGTEVMRINGTNGNVGINTSSPASLLNVLGDANITGTLYSGTFSPSSLTTSLLNVSGQTLLATSSGNVGIGTTSPSARLHVNSGASNSVITAEATTSPKILMKSMSSGEAMTIQKISTVGGGIRFLNNGEGVELMRVQDNGNIGIGTTTPGEKLSVTGNFSTTTGAFLATSSGNVGIGTTTPLALLQVQKDQASLTSLDVLNDLNSAGASARLRITVGGASADDPYLMWGVSNGVRAYAMGVDNSDSDKLKITTNASSATADVSSSTSLFTIDTSGNVGIGTTGPSTILHLSKEDTSNSSVTNLFTLDHLTSTASNGTSGIGSGILFRAEDSLGNIENAGQIQSLLTTATNGSEASALTILTRTAGGSLTERVRVDGSGNVGIGTTNPASNNLQIEKPNAAINTNTGIVGIYSTDSQAINKGGSITFGGVYTGTSLANFAAIRGVKESGTDGNNAGALILESRPNGGATTERMRIDSSGKVGIGTTSPESKFQVDGTNTILNEEGQLRASDATTPAKKLILGYDITGGIDGGYIQAVHGGVTFKPLLLNPSGGKVGIGTTSPNTLLQIHGGSPSTAASGIQFGTDTSANFYRSNTATVKTDGSLIATNALQVESNAAKLLFYTGITNFSRELSGRLDLNLQNDFVIMPGSGGKVGIGTTSPGSKLEVRNDYGNTSDNYMLVLNNGGAPTAGMKSGISFITGDGSAGAKIQAINDGVSGGDLTFLTRGNSTDSEKIRILFNGNVGIGTNNTDARLEVRRTGALAYKTMKISTDDVDGTRLVLANDNSINTNQYGFISGGSSTDEKFAIARFSGTDYTVQGSIIMTFDNSSRVGIGTTSPAVMLHVQQSGEGATERIQDSDGTCDLDPDSGSLVTSCSSDEKLKADIIDTESVLDEFRKIKVRDYTVKSSGKETTGVIAQEVNEVAPELVHEEDGVLFVEQPNPWKLLKAIQELQAQVEASSSGSSPVATQSSSSQYLSGQVELESSFVEVRIEFEKEFDSAPIVTATPVGLPNFFYGVSDVTTSGFSVLISEAQSEGVKFNWHASVGKDIAGTSKKSQKTSKLEPSVNAPDSTSENATGEQGLQIPESTENSSSDESLLTITGQASGGPSGSEMQSSGGFFKRLFDFFR